LLDCASIGVKSEQMSNLMFTVFHLAQ